MTEPGLSPQEEEALREMGNALLADGTGLLSGFIAAASKSAGGGDQDIDANLRHYRAELRAWEQWKEQLR